MRVMLKMAWRNVWRNPRRSILTMGAICFACILLIFMLSMQFGSYETMINATLRIRSGHLQIQARLRRLDSIAHSPPIRDDDAFKTPLIPEQITHQPFVGVHRNTI